jgi:hypothetical protein
MTTMTITTSTHTATVTAYFATPAAAAEFAARFPKSTKLASPTLRGHTLGGMVDGRYVQSGIVKMYVRLRADGVNGGTNETGLKRLATIRRTAAKLGVEIVET